MMRTPLQIYPSQLDAIKTKAKSLASHIAGVLGAEPLSAFKRNDFFSVALGYKGHSDLIASARFRAAGDTGQPLSVFGDPLVVASLAETFDAASCKKPL